MLDNKSITGVVLVAYSPDARYDFAFCSNLVPDSALP